MFLRRNDGIACLMIREPAGWQFETNDVVKLFLKVLGSNCFNDLGQSFWFGHGTCFCVEDGDRHKAQPGNDFHGVSIKPAGIFHDVPRGGKEI